MASKLLIVCALAVVGLGYLLYIPVNPILAEPWTNRITGGLFGVTFLGGFLGEKLGIGSEMNITRYLIDHLFSLISYSVDPRNVQREDAVFNGVPVRIYRPTKPQGTSALPGMVFYHGGGWIVGSIESYDLVTALYAEEANIVVVSVEYRMAPEYPFPVPVEDCKTATEYFINKAARFNVDPKRIALAGDSAGGNLAAAVSLMLRDEKFQPMPKAQVLIYPLLQMMDFNLPSYFEAGRYQKNNGMLGSMIGAYLSIPQNGHDVISDNRHVTPALRRKYGPLLKMKALPSGFIPADYKPTDPNDWDQTFSQTMSEKFVHPYVSPLLADDLGNLPEAFIFTAGTDALRDDGPMFAHRLKEAGVKATWFDLPNTFHGCISMTDRPLETGTGRQANAAIVKFLKETL